MDRTSISIDGKHLDITTSLDNAFKHVRDKRRVLQIWADGICVDQTSVFDRNSQVARMGPIYSTARHTIIFLGKDSNENGSFIAFLSSRKTRLSISGSIDDLLRDFLDRPWFGRVWVLQELVLNVDRWVQIGRHRMRWDDVYQYITKGDSPRKLYQPRTAQEEQFVAMNALRKDHTSSAGDNAYGPSRLLEVLSKRRGCGATNPRDMVFAHLGIAEKWACSNIPVEYGRTIEEVYEGVIKSFFKRTGNLCFLAQFENINPRRTGFPSWVPDWTVPFYHRMPLGDPKSDSQRDISVVIDTPGILAVKGFLCGKVVALIKSTSLPVVGYMGIEPSYADIVQWMNKSGYREILRTLVNLHATSYQMVKKISNSKPNVFTPIIGPPKGLIQSSGVPEIVSELTTNLPVELKQSLDKFMTPEVITRMVFFDICFLVFSVTFNSARNSSVLGEVAIIQDDHNKSYLFSRIPEVACVGDEICSLINYDDEIFIFRPDNGNLEPQHEALLREKLDASSLFSSDTWDLKYCRFIE